MIDKYFKYKAKYLNLKKKLLKGGEVLGNGSNGLIVSNRLPFFSCLNKDMGYENKTQIGKLFFNSGHQNGFNYEYMGYQNFIKCLTDDINFLEKNPILVSHITNDYFLFPLNHGLIDYNEIILRDDIYNFDFLNNNNINISTKKEFLLYLRNNFDKYQISFDKGIPVFDAGSITDINLKIFKLENILEGIRYLQHNNFVNGDLSFNNIIQCYDGKYKIIDFSSTIKLDDAINNFESLKILNNINYYIHPTIIEYLLYKNIINPSIIPNPKKTITDSNYKYIEHNFNNIIKHITENNLKDNIINIKDLVNVKVIEIINVIFLFKMVSPTTGEFLNKRYCDKALIKLYQYYNNAGGIYKLLKKIDMYSFGILLLFKFLDPIIESIVIAKDKIQLQIKINIFNQFIKTITYFTIYCYLNRDTGEIMIFDVDMVDACDQYYILLEMIGNNPI